MGWYGNNAITSAKDMRDSILRETRSAGVIVLGTCTKGNEFWVACEWQGDRSITLYLIESHDGEWGYKPIHEDEGPFYFGCSAKLLALCPDESKRSASAKAWRAKVREQHAKAKREFNAGAACTVYGQPYTIVGEHTRTKMIVRMPNGELRAAPKADIVLV